MGGGGGGEGGLSTVGPDVDGGKTTSDKELSVCDIAERWE